MKRPERFRRALLLISRFASFFLFSAIVLSCCLMLFVTVLADTMGLTLTNDNLQRAAKLTFGNIVFLSLAFTVADEVRRRFMIDRPIRKIRAATERIMSGDFDVHLSPIHSIYGEENFNEIIECFNKMAKELSATQTLRTDFLANVSHEMKTPLAIMQNYGALLQQPDLPEETRLEYARAITDSTRRLNSLVTNILKLNKLENQQIAPKRQPYDLSEQLIQCLLQYESVWEGKDIDLDTDIPDDITVTSDEELLGLVWNNLLSNAFKFTNKGGRVSVSLTADEVWAVVTVSDTGCGMDAAVGAHIFEKFYQGDTSHATQGNGLGLALVKRVVDITKSDISVESVPGKGSSFTVRIRRNDISERT